MTKIHQTKHLKVDFIVSKLCPNKADKKRYYAKHQGNRKTSRQYNIYVLK